VNNKNTQLKKTWEEELENLFNRAFGRGANWACKGMGYALDTDPNAEIEEAIKLIHSTVSEAGKEALEWVLNEIRINEGSSSPKSDLIKQINRKLLDTKK